MKKWFTVIELLIILVTIWIIFAAFMSHRTKRKIQFNVGDYVVCENTYGKVTKNMWNKVVVQSDNWETKAYAKIMCEK